VADRDRHVAGPTTGGAVAGRAGHRRRDCDASEPGATGRGRRGPGGGRRTRRPWASCPVVRSRRPARPCRGRACQRVGNRVAVQVGLWRSERALQPPARPREPAAVSGVADRVAYAVHPARSGGAALFRVAAPSARGRGVPRPCHE
jgi:hypothetical protein